jgi:hypothetical protein
VAGFLDGPHADRAGGPLEAVRRAEYLLEPVGRVAAVRPLLEIEQVAVQGDDVLVELAEEGRHQASEARLSVHGTGPLSPR